MKTFITSLMMFVSVTALAESMFDGKSKEELSNYEITVTDKRTGEVVGKMNRSEYKVVQIEHEKIYIQSERAREEFKESILKAYGHGYTTLIVHGGIGRDGLETEYSGGQYTVTERRSRPVGGVTLCRSVENSGLCGSAFTNETFLLGVKFDFK